MCLRLLQPPQAFPEMVHQSDRRSRAFAPGNLLYPRDEIFFFRGDHVLGAQGEQLSFLVALSRRGNGDSSLRKLGVKTEL
jgi:hypothetical protein